MDDRVNKVQESAETTASLKQPQKRKLLLLAGALVLLVVLVVSLGRLLAELNGASNTEESATHFSSAKALIADLSPQLNGTAAYAVKRDGTGGTTQDGYLVYTLPTYQVAGTSFETSPTEGEGAGYFSNSAAASDNYKKLTAFFAENHFTLEKKNATDTSPLYAKNNTTTISYAKYSSDNLLCAIWRSDLLLTPIGGQVTGVGCADKSSYKSLAKVLEPFYSVYLQANKGASDHLVFAAPVAGEGAANYEYAILHQEDSSKEFPYSKSISFRGYYYKKKADTSWKFFAVSQDTMTQNEIACSMINTDVLKQAFHGMKCYDNAAKKVTTVKS